MNLLMSRGRIGLAVLALVGVGVWLIASRKPYARLEFMGKMAMALSPGGSLRSVSRIAGIIHCADPGVYFFRQAYREEQVLLAAGNLVRTPIKIRDTRSSRDALTALWCRYRQTGAYWSATVDRTNHVVVLISKREDIASFSAALQESDE